MNCSDEITTILAMLQVENVLIRPAGGQASIKSRIAHRKFEVEEGDWLTLLNIYTAFEKNKSAGWCQKHFLNAKALKRATEIRAQMRRLIKTLNIPFNSCEGRPSGILVITENVLKHCEFLQEIPADF